MSTEVTPESLRVHVEWLRDDALARDNTWGALEAMKLLLAKADRLEREQRPLPTVPGWYPTIVVERGGESCTGALLRDDKAWVTERPLGGYYGFHPNVDSYTVRWAEQDGTTPGQTLWETEDTFGCMPWGEARQPARDRAERIAAAVLAAHGTPTLTDEDRGCWACSRCGRPSEQHAEGGVVSSCIYSPEWLSAPTLTPVGEHPEPGTRGLLPVTLDASGSWYVLRHRVCSAGTQAAETILADPRPGGAL